MRPDRPLPLRPSSAVLAAKLPALLLVGVLSAPLRAQRARPTSTELTAVADKVFAQWNTTHGPGCAVGIAQGGTVLLERGYGMADLTGDRPITPSTILESGSVAKQFTATAILTLAHDGKLALDDDARKYLPELPDYGRVITVRHLLTHTSGLREWSNLVDWQGWERGTRVHTNPDIVRLIAAQRALNYPVGDHYSYTNSGFLLLHAIVERVSGQPFAQFLRSRVFAPAGMTHTDWRDDFTRIIPGLAQAYRRAPDGWHLDMPFDNIAGAGGVLTTVGDWLRWNEVLTNKTLGTAIADSLTRRMRLTSGIEIEYALGIIVGSYRGTPQIAHSGSTAGYSTYLARYPALDHLSIAVMCNASGAPATAYVHALVDALAPNLPPVAAVDTVSSDQSALLAWRGVYEDGRYHTTTILDTLRGALSVIGNTSGNANGTTTGNAVRTLRDGTLLVAGQRVRAVTDAKGLRTLRFATSDGDSVVATWRALARWTPTATELAALAGAYQSSEIASTVRVVVRDQRLILMKRDGLETPLTPTWHDASTDAFASDGGAVWFTRDRRGRVTALHVGEARMWDLVFTRANPPATR